MIEFKQVNFASANGILVFPDHYVAVPQYFAKDHSLAITQDDGRKIIKAGTIFPANDATAVGIVFSDLDVTNGDQNGAIIVHGFVSTPKLPVVPAAAAISALKGIEFLPLTSLGEPVLSAVAALIDAGEASDTTVVVPVSIAGGTFRAEAADKANWTVAGASVNKVAVDSISISADGKTAYITLKATDTTVAGSTTVVAKAAVISIGVAPAAAVTVVTVTASE